MMTPEEFKEVMFEICHSKRSRYYDCEPRHIDADELMCEVLRQLGYGEGVDIFDDMEKWYA